MKNMLRHTLLTVICFSITCIALWSSPAWAVPPVFGVETDFDVFEEDIPGWFAEARERGLTLVSFPVFSLDAEMIYPSPTLEKAGFHLYGNLLGDILAAAAQEGITPVFMIEGIGHIIGDMKPFDAAILPEQLTPEATGEIISELAEAAAPFHVTIGVSEEALDNAYMNAVDQAAAANGVQYFHFFQDLKCRPDMMMSEDYAYYPKDAMGNVDDLAYMQMLYDTGAYYGKLGTLNVMFGVAETCGTKTAAVTAGGWGMGPATHQNVALIRAVQFQPDLFLFIVAEDNQGRSFMPPITRAWISISPGETALPNLMRPGIGFPRT